MHSQREMRFYQMSHHDCGSHTEKTSHQLAGQDLLRYRMGMHVTVGGQMILGEALVCRHVGRDWRWAEARNKEKSTSVFSNAFIDKKDSYYSIHQIAQMGVGEGKPIGQWYGPNTVAQVLK
ncbi:cysteine protease ATG4B-like [Etheostoma spectabile]|uniref:cysteine protease ATG4B-like n=1 Tax=Etheostoma spectabile TaxID=54343 RepID=UPI0013AEF860|nr:cysteine protease ATG4B-like [Etheostoma spectabile]